MTSGSRAGLHRIHTRPQGQGYFPSVHTPPLGSQAWYRGAAPAADTDCEVFLRWASVATSLTTGSRPCGCLIAWLHACSCMGAGAAACVLGPGSGPHMPTANIQVQQMNANSDIDRARGAVGRGKSGRFARAPCHSDAPHLSRPAAHSRSTQRGSSGRPGLRGAGP
jgi:hypothetical protein